MNKLLKLGLLSMTALVLGACGGNSEPEPTQVDLGEVEGFEDETSSEGLTLESESTEEEESTYVEEDEVVDVADDEVLDVEGDEDVEWNNDVMYPMDIGESTTMGGVTLTVTDAEFEELPADDIAYGDIHWLKVTYTVENNAENAYMYGVDGNVYADGVFTGRAGVKNTRGNVMPGETAEAVEYFEVPLESSDITFEWIPIFMDENANHQWKISAE